MRACLISALLLTGCLVSTDETLWQRQETGIADQTPADLSPGDLSSVERLWTEQSVPDSADGEASTGKSLGASCAAGPECHSGHCIDKVCCVSSCQGTCRRCDLAGQLGQCDPIPQAADPDDECAKEPVATCGRDGSCDGKGACQLHAAKTVCKASCGAPNDSTFSTCDGLGACQQQPTVSCESYACDSSSGQCFASCTQDVECYRYTCNKSAGSCRTKCNNPAQCQSGFSCKNGKCL